MVNLIYVLKLILVIYIIEVKIVLVKINILSQKICYLIYGEVIYQIQMLLNIHMFGEEELKIIWISLHMNRQMKF
jgi:hypothetical protein